MPEPAFSDILTSIQPDLLICDFFQPWAYSLATSLSIPAVLLVTSGAPPTYSFLNRNAQKGKEDTSSLSNRFAQSLKRSSSTLMLLSSFNAIETKYLEDVQALAMKRIVSIGELVVQDPNEEYGENGEITEWLNAKQPNSVVYVSLGSESYLPIEDIQELAHGLLLSQMKFIWVLRFPTGADQITLNEALQAGELVNAIKDRRNGILVKDWAPQKRILSHENIGGFVSHCGWNSVLESLKFGVPIIATPVTNEQPINARFVEEIGAGIEVKKDENGKHARSEIAKAIKQVVGKESGEKFRKRAREISELVTGNEDEKLNQLVNRLVKLCHES